MAAVSGESATLRIRRTHDGVVVERPIEVQRDDDGHPACFYWSDGNGSCDCNRAHLFDGSESACTDTAYVVQIVGEDGTVLYADDAWDESEAES